MDDANYIWLAADYHLPVLYSCRVPMNSIGSASASPAPGPATIRLALIRTGIELSGAEHTEKVLFPIIRAMQVRIRPPERVALTTHIQHAYKANSKDGLDESIVYREFAHAVGPMTVYIQVPCLNEVEFDHLLRGIAYWGQANGFTTCTAVSHAEPVRNECGMPINELKPLQGIQQLFPCLTTEFRDAEVRWADIIPALRPERSDPIQIKVFIWPLVLRERHKGGATLEHHSMDDPWILKDHAQSARKVQQE